jgi:flavin reductase (DIM6/NTAB) family NADH-FMN oxidoreductase RutF
MTAGEGPRELSPGADTARDLRRAWGQFATGVTVVTARDGNGARGMTANSFISVSLDPPLVLVSIDTRNRTYQLLEQNREFAVSVLSTEHQVWSDRFAGRQGDVQDRFDDIPHTITAEGLPILAGSLAYFICQVVAVHPAGDHSLFIGQVVRFAYTSGGSPLVFFGGGYRAVEASNT